MSAKIERSTKETRIQLEVGAKGGATTVRTPNPFLTHMLESLAKHAGLSLQLRAESHDEVEHHLVEDVAIAVGQGLRRLSGDGATRRFGNAVVPMDDSLVEVTLDAGGRPYYQGPLPSTLWDHFLRSLAFEAGWTLHVEVRRGTDEHHVVEAAVKGLAFALRQALEPAATVASTKGSVSLRIR